MGVAVGGCSFQIVGESGLETVAFVLRECDSAIGEFAEFTFKFD